VYETTAGAMRRLDANRAMQNTRESMLLALQGAEAALRLGPAAGDFAETALRQVRAAIALAKGNRA
jgi:hypothetical protein